MRYESQRVAYKYFTLAALLFGLQVIFGLINAAQYIWPGFLAGILPFNIARMIHLNLMVFWLLLGLMGGVYYLASDEAGAELFSPALANFQFWLLAATGVGAVAGFLFFGYSEGREYLEAPRVFDWLIVVGALTFLFNVLFTFTRGRKWSPVSGVLFGGLAGLSVLYLFGMVFLKSLAVDMYVWWWVIHLWVEGTWELIAAAITAYLLIRLTGIDRKIIEKWLYIEVGLVLLTGILGTGHHYYWIGTPEYWLWIGGIFSALEPLPILLMVFDTLRHVRESQSPHPNKVALYWVVGGAISHFIGAGVMGFIQTLPQINKWTHGTQFTPAHGHLAFFGAYGMLVLAIIYFALPELRRVTEFDQRRSIRVFWTLSVSMLAMSVILLGAGMVQVYLERMLGIDFMTVKNQYFPLWMALRGLAGVAFTVGVAWFLGDYFTLGVAARREEPVGKPAAQA